MLIVEHLVRRMNFEVPSAVFCAIMECGILFLYKECYILSTFCTYYLVVCMLFPARSAINYLKVNA